MKASKTLFLSVLIFFSLIFLSARSAGAAENTEVRYCSTARELYEALLCQSVGIIVLTDNIIWENISDSVTVINPITVDMGVYEIYIPENRTFLVNGPISFYGGTDSQPMFLVEGSLSTSEETVITAFGDNCTAIQIENRGSWEADFTSVSACGRNAVAVSYENGPDTILHPARITAQGTGALALVTERTLQIVLCSITSESGTAVSAASPVSLYGSQVYPEPPDAAAPDCRIGLYDRHLESTGYCYSTGVSSEEIIRDSLVYQLISDDGFRYIYNGSIVMDGLQESYPAAGEYTITVTPVLPEWFLLCPPPMQIPLHIIAPDQPYLAAAYQLMDRVGIQFFSEISDADQLTLFFSEDDGETWRDIMELPGSSLTTLSAEILGLSEEKEYLFYLLAEGGSKERESNILRFSFGRVDIDGGGDDDGGDRGEQELPSYEQEPPGTSMDTAGSESGADTADSSPGNDTADSNSGADTTDNSPGADTAGSDSGADTTGSNSGTAKEKQSPASASDAAIDDHAERPGLQTPPSSADKNTSVPAGADTDKPGDTAPQETPSDDAPLSDRQTPLMEQVTDISTTIAGTRLQLLLQANPESVLFEKQGITVEISSAFLSALHLADDALLKISIQKTDDCSFSLSLRADGSELEALSETTVTMPYPFRKETDTESLSLIHAGTGNKNRVQYLADQNRVSAKIYAAGSYTLQQDNGQIPERLSDKKTASVILYLITGALSLAAVILYLHQRRTRHEKC